MKKFVSALVKVNRYLSWIMLVLFFVAVLSGYSMTAKRDLVMKLTLGLINWKNGYFLHRKSTYFLSILASIHTAANLKLKLLKIGVTKKTLNIFVLIVLLVMIAFLPQLSSHSKRLRN